MKARKKPVEVEVWRNVKEADPRMPKWCVDAIDAAGDDGALFFNTLEGVMRADPGDWIIQGVAGEVYPCKADIFEKTYELIS